MFKKNKVKVIGVCGAQNTGKSTLIDAMLHSRYFSQYVTYPSIIRTVMPKGFDFHSANTEMQLVTLQYQTEYLLKLYADKSSAILDRTVIDNLAYINYYKDKDPSNYFLTDRVYQYILEKTQFLIKYIDVFAFIKPEFPMTADGTRLVDKYQQTYISLEVYRLLKYFGVSGDRLCSVTGTVEDRLMQITAFCKNKY